MNLDLGPEEIPACPHCDQPIEYGDYAVMAAHGMFYLACGMCVAEITEAQE